MRALLVRHARAGDRAEWTGDDRLRPLDGKGRRQARALAAVLDALEATRLLSSPYVRCMQTFEPAAGRLGLEIEERSELEEGRPAEATLALLAEIGGGVPALCTHGDVLEALVGSPECKKGSIWVVDVADGRVRPERYLPPA